MTNLELWTDQLNHQANGFAGWALLVTVAAVLLILIWRRWPNPVGNVKLGVRLAAVLAFGGSLALLLPWSGIMRILIPGGVVGLVAYGWLDYARHSRLHITLTPNIWWIVTGAALLRLPMLFIKAPWYDETFTALLAGRPWGDMLTLVSSDVHPPAFYIIEWVMVHLAGNAPAVLRLAPAVFGVISVWLIYRLSWCFFADDRVALISAVFAAVLPAALNYSNDARMYSMLTCLVLGSALAIMENRPRWFLVTGTLIPLTHNIGYLYLAVLLIPILMDRRFTVRTWGAALFACGFTGVGWLPTMLGQTKDITNGFWLTFTPATVLAPLQTMTIGFRVPNAYLLHVTAAIVGLTVLSLWVLRRWFSAGIGQFWLLLVAGPPALAALVSVVWHPVYLDRAFLPCAMLLTIPWAFLVSRAYSADRIAALAIVAPALAVAVITYYNPDKYYRYDQLIADGCKGASQLFDLKTAGHIIASYYDDRPKVLWTNSDDETQTLRPDAKLAAGWQVGQLDSMQGTVCVLDWYTVHNTDAQTAYMAAILRTYPDARRTVLIHEDWFKLNAYVVNLH